MYEYLHRACVRVCVCVRVCTEDDWETSHLAEVGGEGNSLPTETLHHDDAILGAVPIPTVDPSHTPQSSTADDEVN